MAEKQYTQDPLWLLLEKYTAVSEDTWTLELNLASIQLHLWKQVSMIYSLNDQENKNVNTAALYIESYQNMTFYLQSSYIQIKYLNKKNDR